METKIIHSEEGKEILWRINIIDSMKSDYGEGFIYDDLSFDLQKVLLKIDEEGILMDEDECEEYLEDKE